MTAGAVSSHRRRGRGHASGTTADRPPPVRPWLLDLPRAPDPPTSPCSSPSSPPSPLATARPRVSIQRGGSRDRSRSPGHGDRGRGRAGVGDGSGRRDTDRAGGRQADEDRRRAGRGRQGGRSRRHNRFAIGPQAPRRRPSGAQRGQWREPPTPVGRSLRRAGSCRLGRGRGLHLGSRGRRGDLRREGTPGAPRAGGRRRGSLRVGRVDGPGSGPAGAARHGRHR